MTNVSSLSDDELVTLSQENPTWFGMLIHRYETKIKGLFFFLTRDTFLTEEFSQNTFTRVFQSIRNGKYQCVGKFSPWINRIAWNEYRDYHREKKRRPIVVALPESESLHTLASEHFITQKETVEMVRYILGMLSPENREIIRLQYFEGFKLQEIADMMGIPLGTCKNKLYFARREFFEIYTAQVA